MTDVHHRIEPAKLLPGVAITDIERRVVAPDAARAMVRALTTPEAAAIFKAKGLGL